MNKKNKKSQKVVGTLDEYVRGKPLSMGEAQNQTNNN